MSDPLEKLDQAARSVVREVFELTAMKVDPDDPVVIAALVQSRLLKKAGEDLLIQLNQATELVIGNQVKEIEKHLTFALSGLDKKVLELQEASEYFRNTRDVLLSELAMRATKHAAEHASSQEQASRDTYKRSVLLASVISSVIGALTGILFALVLR